MQPDIAEALLEFGRKPTTKCRQKKELTYILGQR